MTGRPGMPPRRWLVVTRELVENVEAIFREWLEELRGVNIRRRELELTNPFA
jgi:hypothetical protein